MELPNPYNEPPAHTLESVLKLTCAPSSWLHRTLPVCAAGLLGVASLLLLPPPAALLAAAPELAALPPWAQRVLPSLNPLLLVLGFSAIGGALAHRAGLHSILAGTAQGQPTPVRVWIACAGWGLLVGAAVHTLDRLLAPALGQAWQDLAQTQTGSPESRLLVGLVYGGLAEEVIARWGLPSMAGCSTATTWKPPWSPTPPVTWGCGPCRLWSDPSQLMLAQPRAHRGSPQAVLLLSLQT